MKTVKLAAIAAVAFLTICTLLSSCSKKDTPLSKKVQKMRLEVTYQGNIDAHTLVLATFMAFTADGALVQWKPEQEQVVNMAVVEAEDLKEDVFDRTAIFTTTYPVKKIEGTVGLSGKIAGVGGEPFKLLIKAYNENGLLIGSREVSNEAAATDLQLHEIYDTFTFNTK